MDLKTVSEVQQTDIEKLGDSFNLAGFTLAGSFKNSSNPRQFIFFSFFNHPCQPMCQRPNFATIILEN